MSGYIVAITGSRKILEQDFGIVKTVMKELVNSPAVFEIRFGGAIGVDSLALQYALEARLDCSKSPRFKVILPDTLEQQPIRTHEVTRRADEVIELKQKIYAMNGYASIRARNLALVTGAHELRSFWDGNFYGGTKMTMNLAPTGCKVIIHAIT
jgi:hypothetical protein